MGGREAALSCPTDYWIFHDALDRNRCRQGHPGRPFPPRWTVAESAQYPDDVARLIALIDGRPVGNVLLEASGGYERGLMRALAHAQVPVTRINPRRAKAFAQALGRIAKTDPIDAAVLARMAEVVVQTRTTPSAEQETLRALVQRREQLVQQRDDERRRLKQATLPTVRESLIAHIGYLRAQITAIAREIVRARADIDSDLCRRLLAVEGIGEVTAASLLAYLPELGRLDRRQIAALAGLAPYNADSGQHSGKRRIRGGRASIRRVLYMACWSVIRKQPDFTARYQRLRQQGKCAKLAVTACMRVLLIRLNAMARDGTEWRTLPG